MSSGRGGAFHIRGNSLHFDGKRDDFTIGSDKNIVFNKNVFLKSGVLPTEDQHLCTKAYADTLTTSYYSAENKLDSAFIDFGEATDILEDPSIATIAGQISTLQSDKINKLNPEILGTISLLETDSSDYRQNRIYTDGGGFICLSSTGPFQVKTDLRIQNSTDTEYADIAIASNVLKIHTSAFYNTRRISLGQDAISSILVDPANSGVRIGTVSNTNSLAAGIHLTQDTDITGDLDVSASLTAPIISTHSAEIAANTGNISTNTGNIATNSGNIAANSGNIAANTGNISTNTANIATNTANISTNTANISTNTANIATNTGNIATNAGNIATNAGNIAINTGNITSLQTDNIKKSYYNSTPANNGRLYCVTPTCHKADTGINHINTNLRGMCWTGSYYIMTDYVGNAYFYSHELESITNPYGRAYMTIPTNLHGASWDGRYLYCVHIGKIYILDIDVDSTSATTVATLNLSFASGACWGIEVAHGKIYIVEDTGTEARLHCVRWIGGDNYETIFSDVGGGTFGESSHQSICFDGSHLYLQHGGAPNVYVIKLDGTIIQYYADQTNIFGMCWNGREMVGVDSAGNFYRYVNPNNRLDQYISSSSSTLSISPEYRTVKTTSASTINLPDLTTIPNVDTTIELTIISTHIGAVSINADSGEYIYTHVEGNVSSFTCTGPFTAKLIGCTGNMSWYIASETGVYKQSSIAWLNTGTVSTGETKLYLAAPAPNNLYSNDGVVAHRPMRVTHIRLMIDNEMTFGTDISLVINARDSSGTDDKRATITTVASMTSWTGLGNVAPLRTWEVDTHEVIPPGEMFTLSVYSGNYDASTTTGWAGSGSECYAISDIITYT
jgi:methyl-accepting chemotaxis protein